MLDAILLGERRRPRRRAADRCWVTWCDQVAVHPSTVAAAGGARPAHARRAALVMPTVQRRDSLHSPRSVIAAAASSRVLHRREGDAMPEVGRERHGPVRAVGDAYLDALADVCARRRQPGAGPASAISCRSSRGWRPAQRRRHVSGASTTMEAVGVNTPEELRGRRTLPGARRQRTT